MIAALTTAPLDVPSHIASHTASAGLSLASTLAQAGATSPGVKGLLDFMPFILIFVVFYFMLIRPQQKKAKELEGWLKSLKKGDEVVTSGGLIGKISGLTESIVTLEVQEKVRLRVLRSHVSGRAPGAPGVGPAAPSAPAPDAQPPT